MTQPLRIFRQNLGETPPVPTIVDNNPPQAKRSHNYAGFAVEHWPRPKRMLYGRSHVALGI